MRAYRFALPLAAAALALTACSTSTEEAETNTSAAPESCSFDKTVDGVTAVQEADSAPELVIAKGATPPKALVIEDLCPGNGEEATPADTVTVDYVGVGYKSRKVFDSSFERGQPAQFPLSGVIPGWTQGVTGMKPGGARLLLIPADLAYGKAGAPPAIAPDEALAFIVELDEISTGSNPTGG